MITSYARRRISPRSRGGIPAKDCCAAAAAASASIPSSGLASATSQRALPVAGSSTVRVRPDAARRHSPPMNKPVGTESTTLASSAVELLAAAEFVIPRCCHRGPADASPQARLSAKIHRARLGGVADVYVQRRVQLL